MVVMVSFVKMVAELQEERMDWVLQVFQEWKVL